MNRELTNKLRYVLDEMIPPFIRDSRWFMYPIFYYWFNGQFIDEIMDFKKNVYKMTPQEYENFYRKIKNKADERQTDMNEKSIEYLLENIPNNTDSLLDVGSGRGYFINKVFASKKVKSITGCDFYNGFNNPEINYQHGFIEQLPFEDKSFDIVTCTHTIEHILDLNKALSELKRVARKKIMIVTPRQKYYYYTLDQHVNFFPTKELLVHAIDLESHVCIDVQGDWVYIGDVK
jgi:ubiquinone/menaquinone biosynthesis C-methylase UbiE